MTAVQDTSSVVGAPQVQDHHCPGCRATMRPFFEVTDVPVNSCILMKSAQEARRYPLGNIVLGFCEDCGFIRNLAFDPQLAEYSGRYEETQGYSATFRDFHERLAKDLIDRYNLRDKDILEIGCGKGEFLALLCELGGNRGVGFDPGYDNDRGILDDIADTRIVADFFSQKYADERADLVCCKMTLEHIQDTAEFVSLSRQAMRPDGSSVLYYQVPESMRILEQCAFEDIYYEHCSYFTTGSLARLFIANGFGILDIRTEYDGQYLAIEAELARDSAPKLPAAYDDLAAVRQQAESFPERCTVKINSWRESLNSARERGAVVIWGSGSKAVSFLGAVDKDGAIDRVVDINPYRQSHFMPGTGQPIVAPQDLKTQPPATIVVMNSIYREEIRSILNKLDVEADILCL